MQSAMSNPEALDTDTAIGVINVIVPTDVPMATDTKQATTNNTATENLAGISDNMKYATLSALLLPTTPTNAPAVKKIRSIVIIFLSSKPLRHDFQLSVKTYLAVLQACHQNRCKKCDYDRNIIESHRNLHYIFKCDSKPQIDTQKYAYWQ